MSQGMLKAMFKIREHSVFFWVLSLLMYVFYLVGHNPVSEFCYFIRDTYTEAVYRHYIQLTGIVVLIVHGGWLIWRLWMRANRLKKALMWGVFLTGVGYYYSALIVFAIEYVHFIQYCCLTIVLFRAFNERYLSAIGMALVLGLLDELYQAYHPVTALNWRDVLLNVLGVVWGYLVLVTVEDDSRVRADVILYE